MSFIYKYLALGLLLISAGPLGLALLAQYGFGLMPCELCIWQRYPYGALMALALLALVKPSLLKPVMLGSAILWLAEAGLAFYHVGVEQHWWASATGCSAGAGVAASLDALRASIMGAPLVACDAPALVVAGLSMAGWNVLYSLAMALCLAIIIKQRKQNGATW